MKIKKYFHLCLKDFNVALDEKKTMEEEIHEERDAVIRQEYFDPIN
jgi:hypothetical protein